MKVTRGIKSMLNVILLSLNRVFEYVGDKDLKRRQAGLNIFPHLRLFALECGGKLPPKKIAPRKIDPRKTAPGENCPKENCPPENCPLENYPPLSEKSTVKITVFVYKLKETRAIGYHREV